MIYSIIGDEFTNKIVFISILLAFIITCVGIHFGQLSLPRDAGRLFAHNGKVSEGKPRGAGFIFILVFSIMTLLFVHLKSELIIYILLTFLCMLTGYFDDRSTIPWGEYKKGFLDLILALLGGITYLYFHSNTIELLLINRSVLIPTPIFLFLAVILFWGTINVTNCSDGVDGLSGTLSIITLATIYIITVVLQKDQDMSHMILLFIVCILGYLWYNASPSKLIMGDAGSRAIGYFIGIAVLKTGSPFLILLVAFMLIADGGSGLVKVFLLRFFKIHILTNVRTPIHDHVRKNKNWSDTQVVFKFSIIQIVVSMAVILGLIL